MEKQIAVIADFQVDDRLGRVEGDDFGMDGDLVAGLQLSVLLLV